MKVCLIGNNLTSLVLANILSEKEFDCSIYSLTKKNVNFPSRTLGITNYNFKFLKKYFPKIVKKSNGIDKINILINNGKIKEKVIFEKKSNSLFQILKYNDFYKELYSQSIKNNRINFIHCKKNYLEKLVSKSKKHSIIINCERSNFLTKKYLKQIINKNYLNKAFTTIVRHSKLSNEIATQIFTEYGPIAYLPLSKTLTSIVFSFDIKKKTNISLNEIQKKIREFNPLYKIISFGKIESFDLFLKLPKKYYYNDILFFGDSIHSIHPLAGQGFNMTIRDIIKLNNIIEKKINLGLDVDKNIYKEFETLSKSVNSTFAFGIDMIHELFKFNRNIIPTTISKNFFKFLNKNQKLKNISIKFADQGF